MDRTTYHKYMYTIAAIWNWALAIGFLVLPRIDMGYFSLAGPIDAPPSLIWFDNFFGFVFIFGLGYYLVSKNITENHGLIKICICEKNWVFILAILYFLIGHASLLVVGVAFGDFLFGLLFLEDYRAILKM
jgi:hypothetical protein